jgi:peptidoglycan/LPS O-acetylase OafA/YrhL
MSFSYFVRSSSASLFRKARATALMKRAKASRYGFIDSIRGIAACLVLLQHSLYQSGLLGVWPGGDLTGFIPTWLELGETGVVAFFLVSGFVIPFSLERTGDFGLFWVHRALRIYPLYVTVFVLTILVSGGGEIHSIRGWLFNGLAHAFFLQEYLGQENFVGGSWTLSLEMVWYISISGLFLVSLNKRPNVLVSLSVLVSVLAQISCALGHHLPMGRLSMLVCCVFGLVCYRRDQDDISDKHFALLSAVLSVTIVLNLFVGFQLYPGIHSSAPFKMVIVSWVLAAIMFFTAFFMRQASLWQNSVFSFLGRISYSVYLLHAVVLYVLSLIPLVGIQLIGVAFVVTIGLSTLTYQFIELPPIRFGHSLKAKQRATSVAELSASATPR